MPKKRNKFTQKDILNEDFRDEMMFEDEVERRESKRRFKDDETLTDEEIFDEEILEEPIDEKEFIEDINRIEMQDEKVEKVSAETVEEALKEAIDSIDTSKFTAAEKSVLNKIKKSQS